VTYGDTPEPIFKFISQSSEEEKYGSGIIGGVTALTPLTVSLRKSDNEA